MEKILSLWLLFAFRYEIGAGGIDENEAVCVSNKINISKGFTDGAVQHTWCVDLDA